MVLGEKDKFLSDLNIRLPMPDWIQGYMYTLGRRGLRVSNSPVSS